MAQYVIGPLAALMLCSATVHAQGAESADAESHSGTIPEQNYRGIRYATGGVGAREQEQIAQMAREYDLEIVMTTERGAYLSGVELAFRNSHGEEVLLATSDGPFFLIDLPAGRYEVAARRPSAPIERRSVEVDGRGRKTLHFALHPRPS